ncbi:gluzincin family metallopeptidase [Flavobacterium phycosphaerae]|uniref:M1 family metallopeptidase n=1 Tax=Flavobacterium phycosphaerae TaxID=2697515 RepID=UPI00138AC866|nr:M1 family metallopeptidase [Flavobacterium phycosphaerae]
MNFRILTCLIVVSSSIHLFSQESAPHLKGKVKISIKEGTFDCDLTLSNIPRIQDYLIRLNSGMNLLHIRSKKPNDFVPIYDKSDKDSTSTGESSAYYLPGNAKNTKFLPEELQFRYVGKFPVANDTIENFSRQDWKGNIAFNGISLRTDGRQSAWYPIIYDAKKDIVYDRVVYDIEIICPDCATIYANGNKPVSSTNAHLKSNEPEEIALFCGNYNVFDDSTITILNPKFPEEKIKQFSTLVSSYKKYYEQKLNIPFNQTPTFINTTPTSKKNGWLFVVYPTIMGIGWGENGLAGIFEEKSQKFYKPLIAHELGHYYFGTIKVFNTELGDMMSEGFTEYMALKLTEENQTEKNYDEVVARKIKDLKDFKPNPFAMVKSITDISDRETYVYDYAPIIFIAIEKEIGKKKMWEWLKNILETQTAFTNYDFLVSTLKSTLKNDKKTASLINDYFNSPEATANAIKKITEK